MIQKFKKTEHKYELNVNQLNNMKNIYINVFKIGKQRKKKQILHDDEEIIGESFLFHPYNIRKNRLTTSCNLNIL